MRYGENVPMDKETIVRQLLFVSGIPMQHRGFLYFHSLILEAASDPECDYEKALAKVAAIFEIGIPELDWVLRHNLYYAWEQAVGKNLVFGDKRMEPEEFVSRVLELLHQYYQPGK
ncbi:MAG TPA: hypothetical protein DCG49_01200 [Ruminococcus sp.]|nr:hypothetical protein [Ruminococcus sp.]